MSVTHVAFSGHSNGFNLLTSAAFQLTGKKPAHNSGLRDPAIADAINQPYAAYFSRFRNNRQAVKFLSDCWGVFCVCHIMRLIKPMTKINKIIIHWTAGAHTPSNLDKQHYHKIIDGAGKVHDGRFPISANANPVKGNYAAHTLNCNTGSIGVAVAAMAGAQERPFKAGTHPITDAQVKTLVALCASLAKQYGIAVTPETILTHAEVQPTLKIKQRGKWDIAWLPGMDAPGDPVAVGNRLRAMIAMQSKPQVTPKPVDDKKPADPVTKPPKLGLAGVFLALMAAATVWLSDLTEWVKSLF